MELTFVHQYGNATPKRRRLAKACQVCRARKKRCIHTADQTETGDDQDVTGRSDDDNDDSDNARNSSRPTSSSKRRFVSDLKPESTFLPRRSLAQNQDNPQNEDIGVWVDKREWDALVRQRDRSVPATSSSTSRDKQRPHSAVLGPLIDIYFRKIHPILPIIDEQEFRENHAGGTVDEPLAHAVCLVAAKDAEAEPHLRLTESTTTLAPREFCSRMHASVMAAIRVPVRFEKITLIRILALASLHAEGPEGAEEASMCLTQAMHYTQSLGWHLGQQTGVVPGDDLTTKRLFWCLWTLDRLNSCLYGRPIMMADVDIGIEAFEPGESGFPAFEVWIYLSQLLNKTISFYRPGNPLTVTGWEENYPSFEDALDHARAWSLPQPMLLTLHLYYLLLAVLSHRSRGVKFMPRASPSYIRQSLCTLELNRLMTSRHFSALSPLPILPYAVSLALSVSYQHLRQSKLLHQQEDARQDFRQSCQALQKMRRTWSSADTIAAISKTVLERLEKATDLSSFSIGREARASSPGICPASMNKPHTLIDERTAAPNASSEDPGLGLPGAVHDPTRDSAIGASVSSAALPEHDSIDFLFEGIDDIFGTYLDPNNPVHLDDYAFMDDVPPLDWNATQP